MTGRIARVIPEIAHLQGRWAFVSIGVAIIGVATGLAALGWPRSAEAASVWCDDGIVNGSSWSSRVVSYADPACSGVTHYFAYDHYDTMNGGVVVNIYLNYARAWRCGTLVYYQSDGPNPGQNTSSRNTWISWISGYSPSCGPQSDHHSHYYKSGVIDAWAYVNENSS
ncbi:MAG: hypothetical protein R3B97_04230 [Dehalococcoidia bacterium]|nr:hypothetical protein [Dehalococcoidia bacterium]MCB9485477.1 hypothetical protein [Thermoflexaceae bacterium]